MRRRTLILSLALLSVTASAGAVAPNTNRTPHGISGYDVVAYFSDRAAVRGRPEFATAFAGVTWLFATEEHKQQFERSPEKFLPVYLGYCAYGVARNYLVRVDPHAWSITNGRLYLNYSLAIREKWLKDRARFIAEANENWPQLNK